MYKVKCLLFQNFVDCNFDDFMKINLLLFKQFHYSWGMAQLLLTTNSRNYQNLLQ